MKRGLIIGKFMPIHKGHMALIEYGARHCDELTVIVCSQKGEEIQGKLRYQWVQSIYKSQKNIKVRWFSKKLHGANLPMEKATKIWGRYIREHYGNFDYVFSSETYGNYLAGAINAEHIIFDKSRVNIPISATMIRKNPEKYWEYIPDPVKTYFIDKRNRQIRMLWRLLCGMLGIITLNKVKCSIHLLKEPV